MLLFSLFSLSPSSLLFLQYNDLSKEYANREQNDARERDRKIQAEEQEHERRLTDLKNAGADATRKKVEREIANEEEIKALQSKHLAEFNYEDSRHSAKIKELQEKHKKLIREFEQKATQHKEFCLVLQEQYEQQRRQIEDEYERRIKQLEKRNEE
jgi:hypothetical protein